MQFTQKEIEFIENYGLGDSYMFDEDTDEDEYDQKEKTKALVNIAKECAKMRDVTIGICTKVEHLIPKADPAITKALTTLISKHSVTPPPFAIETLALHVQETVSSWA